MDSSSSILLLDDDEDILIAAKFLLKKKFEKIVTHSSLAGLKQIVTENDFNVALLDMNYSMGDTSGNDGMQALQIIRSVNPNTKVIMMTAYGDIDLAITAIKHGAFDFIVKPWDNAKLLSTVLNAYQQSKGAQSLPEVSGTLEDNEESAMLTQSEVERIFMFLDLNSSTAIAESLGHKEYFNFLNDFFSDIAQPISDNRGDIYQYVGDEVVVTWTPEAGFKKNACLHCFFEIKKQIEDKAAYYVEKYDVKPGFKAGMHVGLVTTGLVGTVKKEVVYTGDVLNTTSRLETLCKGYGRDLLVSNAIVERLENDNSFAHDLLGSIALKGKVKQVEIYAVDKA